jgi:hypothetical protein
VTHLFRIDLRLGAAVVPSALLATLGDWDWAMASEGTVFFMLGGDDDFDWQLAPAAEEGEVVRRLDEAAARGEHVGASLRWRGGPGGELLLFPGGRQATFTGSIDRQVLAAAPPFTDTGWYLARLVPALAPLGLAEVTVQDSAGAAPDPVA